MPASPKQIQEPDFDDPVWEAGAQAVGILDRVQRGIQLHKGQDFSLQVL
jgi:hypothetical protein